jgi:uncharacterized protein (TIGR00730 family)
MPSGSGRRQRDAARRRTGDPDLDVVVEELARRAGGDDADLVGELLATSVRLGFDDTDRGDLKLAAGALREMRRSFGVFEPFQSVPKVTVFGSARTPADDPGYAQAIEFARKMTAAGWMVITGAGPGIMRAANVGAGRRHGFGLNIMLPFEQEPNTVLEGDPKLMTFRYFFTRKLSFVKEARAFAFFPGGFGTMDEAFETLTLMQTGKSDLHPIVLLDPPGDTYWSRWDEFVRAELLARGMVSPPDVDMYHVTQDVDAAVAEICAFYDNYVSQRFVDGTLYLRLRRLPDDATLAELNREFAPIITGAPLQVVPPHPVEVADGDEPDLPRLAFGFDRGSFGRLRHLIDELNRLP